MNDGIDFCYVVEPLECAKNCTLMQVVVVVAIFNQPSFFSSCCYFIRGKNCTLMQVVVVVVVLSCCCYFIFYCSRSLHASLGIFRSFPSATHRCCCCGDSRCCCGHVTPRSACAGLRSVHRVGGPCGLAAVRSGDEEVEM